ncbi:zinc knuckle CX2CX4HX4C containing protein, partial [Tanacetum coccineum]
MSSQDARLSMFEADFKQQHTKVTNKIDTPLKVINDRMTSAPPSDTVKNPKVNVNSNSLVSSARSYPPMEDPQSSYNSFQSVNVIKMCFKSTNLLPKGQQQTKIASVNKNETPKPKEPEKALKDEFKDLHLNLPVLVVLAHALMYNAILDKYVERLELGINRWKEKKKGNEGEEQPDATDGYSPTAISMMTPIDVNKVNKVTVGITEVTDVANNTSNGSSINPTTTTGPSYPTPVGQESVVKDTPTSYAAKLNPTSLIKANLQKLDANVPHGDDYDVWLPLASVHEVNDIMTNSLYDYFIGVDSMLRDGPWMIRGIPIFLNKWFRSVSLLKKELSRVSVWVKFYDIPLVAYTSDGLSLLATKIGTPMILDSYTNSICLESWGVSSYARILIEIDASNGFSNNLVMAVLNLEGPEYMNETIRVEYKREPPRCSTYLIFGHLVDNCPKSPKRVVNRVDKGKGGSSGADDDGFIEVKKEEIMWHYWSPLKAPSVGKKNVSTSCSNSKMT